MAFKTVLIGLDQSSQADAVFQQALDLVQPAGVLIIFHALDLDLNHHTGPFLGIGTLADVDAYSTLKHHQREYVEQQMTAARVWLDQFRQIAHDQGLQAEVICRVGKPGDWICDLAQNHHADLIVMGRRGRSGVAEIVLGSVSNHVVHQAPCAVLVIQGPMHPNPSAQPTQTLTISG